MVEYVFDEEHNTRPMRALIVNLGECDCEQGHHERAWADCKTRNEQGQYFVKWVGVGARRWK